MLAPSAKPSPLLPLHFAWRELRGGMRGFGVFIACIALGVLAIAGVGSVAKGLADGLASAGSVILGGDLAFSLVQREADEVERAFLATRGTLSAVAITPDHGAHGRRANHFGRSQSGRRGLPAIGDGRDRARDEPSGALGATRRHVRRCRRSGAPLALRSQARRSHHHWQCRDRTSRCTDRRTGQACRRDRLWAARADQPGGVARQRAVAARQPGALAIPAAAARSCIERCRGGFDRKTGADTVSRCRLGYPHPQQGHAATRTQCRALQPVPDAGRVDRAPCRRRRRGERSRKPSCPQARGDRDHENAWRNGRRRIRRLLHADHDRRAVRHADWRRSRRGVAVCNRVVLRPR